MSREGKILKNTAIYAVGNFGSKILAYVMVLVYTHFISPNELGYYDLILTTISLALPIVMCSFDEGIYRWLVDSNKNINDIISTSTKIIIGTTFIAGLVLIITSLFVDIQYANLIIWLLSSMAFYQLFLNAVRGLSNSKTYATSGIINSAIDLLFEFLGLVILNMGVEALLISKTIANIVTVGYLCIKQPELKACLKGNMNLNIAKSMLAYSLPLIPNSVSWWIVNSSSRYIISIFLGTAFNGIYSISNKFPTIITTITGIVYFSLQESIIKEYNSPDRNEFYSKIFKQYYTLLFSLVTCAIPATKIIIIWFVNSSYITAWRYTGFLYIGTVFSALSSLLGIGYQISRETRRSVISTVIAAAINALVNIILIKYIGLYSASLSTMLAYIFLFVLRIIHSKRYFLLQIQWGHFGVQILFACVAIAISFIPYVSMVLIGEIIIVLFVIYINKKFVINLFNLLNKKRHL